MGIEIQDFQNLLFKDWSFGDIAKAMGLSRSSANNFAIADRSIPSSEHREHLLQKHNHVLLELVPQRSFDVDIEKRLSRLSQNERQDLEQFFRIGISKDSLGYALFFDKPLTLVDLSNGLISKQSQEVFFRGLEVLKKNFGDRFKFGIGTSTFRSPYYRKDQHIDVFLFNPEKCIKLVEDNHEIFSKRIKDFSSAKSLVDDLKTNRRALSTFGSAALGILLGYGTENALGFEKQNQLSQEVKWNPFARSKLNQIRNTKRPFNGQVREEIELDSLVGKIVGEDNHAHWEADDATYRASLVKRAQQRYALSYIFRQEDFLERVLEASCSAYK